MSRTKPYNPVGFVKDPRPILTFWGRVTRALDGESAAQRQALVVEGPGTITRWVGEVPSA